MVEVKNLTMRFANELLFENVSLKLVRGQKYGLIGANGAGKSTFLKILSKELEASSGEIIFDEGLKVAVLEQNHFAFENYSVKDAVLCANERLYKALKEKESLYASAEFTDSINERLSELEMICAEEDPNYDCELRCEKILSSLNIRDCTIPMKALQNADKFKVLLARVLFLGADVLFLDEPTNNLDLKSISWLEDELLKHEGTLVVISHDRHFLNKICTRILDVDFKKIRDFSGNYDDWYMASTLLAKQAQLKREKTLKDREELESFIRRFSANASKAKQATSRAKALEKLEIEEIQISSRRDPSILFRPKREIGNEILQLQNISKSYELTLFNKLELKIEKNDKIALIGANGSGKSTLAKIITGELKPDEGSVHLGATIELSYFPQDTSNIICENLKLYEWLMSEKLKDLDEIRKCLGRMLFSGMQQEKMAASLSGGEKHRLMLSRLMLERGNFLLLDEPDNHLDLESIIALGEALYTFNGVVLCISHDRELVSAFANRIWHLEDGILTDFRGCYQEFLGEKNGYI
ncbi:ABC-F family ATP-binding cassette domain-containing protein [Campylobacter sp. MIT 21-1685]|uniref:ABC-F family ATP-binding cassette domain-containing protein n=1 Tax=unclassified Campylobacter TaxID=2593542 RepID=UPI00224A9D20|nr:MULTISPECIES: ABC-F family ATP-binding cassette domain-containing protein [unclassified Campylobacter]MCX2683829.1 ABC-F family ATP-binding cassette domain-containing protein [Campylobacter sp. MIT 21-1684]MCX2752113.1 ABC-F family ATP-binding cassette domain-containing protein [Campylobacter sp. MIT 21-1682]MCX2808306.1 ABC-F family ATP-binding cassette domain-containing protein [Campylobacter sp. MIT 21-1685]